MVDPITLTEMPVGEVGEIITNGPMVFMGYWRHPEATAAAFVEFEGKQFCQVPRRCLLCGAFVGCSTSLSASRERFDVNLAWRRNSPARRSARKRISLALRSASVLRACLA